MDRIFAEEEIDATSPEDFVSGEIATIAQDWNVVTQMLPANWQAKATELGAIQRRLRNFPNVESLLRVMLIHLADGCSLRETAVRASAGNMAKISDVALLKRLRSCGAWFQWMAKELATGMSLNVSEDHFLAGRCIRLIDGSSVCEPGATGSTWRLHYALNLRTLSCDEVHVTQAKVGESLTHFAINAGDVVMADRGFANRRGLRHVVEHKADVVLRMNLTNLPVSDERGQALDVLSKLRTLSVGQNGDWPAWVQDDKGRMAVRVCAYKKTLAQTRTAQKEIEQEAKKKDRQVKPETLEAAGYVIVLTTLMQPSATAIMEFYRKRWQIELAFKRLKSLLQLGHLKKYDKDSAKAWLQGKLLVACLIETLIHTAERFSPWGYPATTATNPTLSLA